MLLQGISSYTFELKFGVYIKYSRRKQYTKLDMHTQHLYKVYLSITPVRTEQDYKAAS